ncbi:MAG TPA: D-alanine--D-alanine ligase [Pseudomonadota bacterium]|jgi:D-alanine-D-alanine ligase|nr:D-alanine--D-alanine ligase [Deltaproteobacteria bacterium]HPH26550.1 D-alanine--D-alanine ligase [Pseudomonadota bacterium]
MDPKRPPSSGNSRSAAASQLTPDSGLTERRILVLHNQDFEPDSTDPDVISRADVANAARDVARALAARGHFVEVQGIDVSDIDALIKQLRSDPPDLVFNLVESLSGDAKKATVVPALLDMLDIPYTGPGALSLTLTLDKHQTKQLLRAAGIPTSVSAILPGVAQSAELDLHAVTHIDYPMIVKLAEEDGSLGLTSKSVCFTENELRLQLAQMRERYPRHPLLIEQYIDGREIYVSMLGNRPMRLLHMLEIDFSLLPKDLPRIVSYDGKWKPSSIEYRGTVSGPVGALDKETRARIEEVALRSFEALAVCDYGRCDIRLSSDGTPYVLEVNANCDVSDGAGYSRAGMYAGISYDQLVEQIVFAAIKRNAHAVASHEFDQPTLYSPQSAE